MLGVMWAKAGWEMRFGPGPSPTDVAKATAVLGLSVALGGSRKDRGVGCGAEVREEAEEGPRPTDSAYTRRVPGLGGSSSEGGRRPALGGASGRARGGLGVRLCPLDWSCAGLSDALVLPLPRPLLKMPMRPPPWERGRCCHRCGALCDKSGAVPR